MINKKYDDWREVDDMLNYIDSAIRSSHGGPYCDEEYKKKCIEFIENLIDAVLP